MRFVFFFQTSNLHLIKQKYFFLKIIFIIKHIRKTIIFLKNKIETKQINKCIKREKKLKIDKIRIEKIKT
jgi:hypothetical protein